jgi:hypothetical protein
MLNASPITSFFFFFLVAPTLGSLLPLLEHRAEFPQFLDQGQSVGLLGRLARRKASTCTQTQKNAYTYTNTKHPCPEWDSNPRSRLPNKRRQCTIGYRDRPSSFNLSLQYRRVQSVYLLIKQAWFWPICCYLLSLTSALWLQTSSVRVII